MAAIMDPDDLESFYESKLQQFSWFKPYTQVLDNTDPNHPKWFVGGELSLCFDFLDKHVINGHGNDIAFIADSYYTKTSDKTTYKELLDKVSRLAGAFKAKGIVEQDHIMLYMATTIETIIAMLACIRIGAVYSILYAGFSEEAIAERIDDFKPKIIVTATSDFGLNLLESMKEILDGAIGRANHQPNFCIVWQRSPFDIPPMVPERDFEFYQVIESAEPCSHTQMDANKPAFVIYTSGTTGKPKGVVNSYRGLAMSCVLDGGQLFPPVAEPVLWVGSSLAWLAGHTAGCYQALYNKVPSVIYEGTFTDADADDIYEMMQKHKVTSALIATPYLKIMKHKDSDLEKAKNYLPFKHLKALFAGAMPLDLDTLEWTKAVFGRYPLQFYAQTEVGTIISYHPNHEETRPDVLLTAGKPAPGIKVKVLKENGTEAGVNEDGELMIKLPLPPTVMMTLLNNDRLYKRDLLDVVKGYFALKDYGKIDSEGNVHVYGRSDSVFKVGIHGRISCSAIEEVMASHSAVAECIVIIRNDVTNCVVNQIPEGFFVLKAGTNIPVNDIAEQVLRLVHEKIGTFIPMPTPHPVARFPRTLSGKINRVAISNMFNI